LSFLFSFIPFKVSAEKLENPIRNLTVLAIGGVLFFLLTRAIIGITNDLEIEASTHDLFNIIRISYFTSLPVLIISLIGLLVFVKRAKYRYLLLLIPILAIVAINLYSSQHSNPAYWWIRRYLVFTIPVICFTFAYGSIYLYDKISTIRALLLVGLLVLIGYFTLNFSRPAILYKQNAGINSQVELFAENFPIDAAVILPHSTRFKRVGLGLSGQKRLKLNYHTEEKLLSIEKISALLEKEDKVFIVNPAQEIIDSLADHGYYFGISFAKEFNYSYYFSSGQIFCENGNIFCSWDNAMTTYTQEFKLYVIEVLRT
jgi:hypothetical protein